MQFDLKQTIFNNKIQAKKTKYDNFYKLVLIIISSLVVFFLFSIILVIFIEGISGFFKFSNLKFGNFIFGNYYNPTGEAFAAGFMIVNTLWISAIALLIATPISIFTALFVTRVLPKKFRGIFFVVITILAAIPSVIYGAFGLFLIDSFIQLIFSVPAGTALSVIITLSFMIMPTITILTISSIDSVDKKMENSALALGATKTQTSFKITLRAASKGILVAILLGLGRALGEATAVSMVASQSSYGPTFNPLGFISLITANMLQGFPEVAPGSIEQANMIAMAALLLLTIIIVFSVIRIIENKIDLETIAKKASNKISRKKEIYEKIENYSVYHLTKSESVIYIDDKIKTDIEEDEIKFQNLSYQIANIKSTNSYKKNENKKAHKFKTRQSNLRKSLIYFFSMFGIVLLLSIVLFLFTSGLKVLNWDYISSSGVYKVVDNQNIYGLATPIFGTIFTIIIALLISFPLGVSIAILLSVYLKRSSKLSNILGIFIQLLSGIPSLIYGIIGFIIFVPLFSNNIINFNSLSGAFTISLFILPTVIKTTQEGFNSISKTQKQASLALGGTNLITTRKVLFRQALPHIISSAVLAAGLVIADSAIFITIYGTFSQNFPIDWIQNGGTTLASEIYKLTKQEVILWNYVKAIGIVIIFLIIIISALASFIKNQSYKESLALIIGMLFMFVGIFTAIEALFIIGIIFSIGLVLVIIIFKYLNKKFLIIIKTKRKYYIYKNGL